VRRPLSSATASKRDFTFVRNVVDANLRAETTKGIGEIINVANGKQITLNEL
jgi:nucleoside-diphosphate-sugar epimerase